MSFSFKLSPEESWVPAALVAAVSYPVIAALLPSGYPRSAFADVASLLFTLVAVWAMARNALETEGTVRAFWALMAAGCLMWATLEGCWVYFEVVSREAFPRPSPADALFFLRLVPFLAAIALQPHARRESALFRPGLLDLTILLAWWVHLYVFIVLPWQYVWRDDGRYFASHEELYLVARVVYLAILAGIWWRASGAWRKVYLHLMIATVLYFASSVTIRRAIEAHRFRSGSWYEIFLVAAICWYAGTAVTAHRLRPNADTVIASGRLGVWLGRFAVVAMLSLPVLALESVLSGNVPAPVMRFRLLVTVVSILLFGVLLFLKEHIFEQELLRLLRESRESYENMTVLEAKLVQQEKLASLGRLVAGAARDIDNPLTVILGYSDMLVGDGTMAGEPHSMAEKIRDHARRTKVLIDNLLSFSRQSPGQKTMVDVNLVLESAARLREIDLTRGGIRLERELKPLPKVWADEYKLLEVCLHILNNSVEALSEQGGGEIRVRSRVEKDQAVLEIADNGPGVTDPERIFEPFYTTKRLGKGAGLGLSACYGIVKEHGGEIVCRKGEGGGAVFEVRLPLAGGKEVARAAEAVR